MVEDGRWCGRCLLLLEGIDGGDDGVDNIIIVLSLLVSLWVLQVMMCGAAGGLAWRERIDAISTCIELLRRISFVSHRLWVINITSYLGTLSSTYVALRYGRGQTTKNSCGKLVWYHTIPYHS